MNSTRSRVLQERLLKLVPGGSHTYAKGADQFPESIPGVIARGAGSHVWDVDGNEYIEYGMGLRAVTLGHAFPPVIEAVARSLSLGTNFTRPAAIELDCAERFLGIVDGADMVKFTKDGSTANTAALRLARAYTGRELVVVRRGVQRATVHLV
jgi:glutamate-1-semialdehyde 2,1-aminomutase